MSNLENLVGQVLDQKYKIEAQLGQGGMGAVYRATHLGTERPVAVKVIMPEFMQEKRFIERFKREAKATGRLRHPNVVNVTDFGFAPVDTSEVAYLVMEFLDGITLGGLLEKEKILPLELVVDIIEQTCLAVSEAHKLGIVHRDLKPDNIWLQPNGRGGYNVKVLDFGLAQLHDLVIKPQQLIVSIANGNNGNNDDVKTVINLEAKTQIQLSSKDISPITLETEPAEAATLIKPPAESILLEEAKTAVNIEEAKTVVNIEEAKTIINTKKNTHGTNKPNETNRLALEMGKITQIGGILGTPLYMSPEQCQGLALDFRTDIYSLGIIIYQMLTGSTPFQGNIYKLLELHVKASPPPLTQKEHKIPSAIARVVMSALDKDAAKRPVSALAFAASLKANSQGELPIIRDAISLYRKNFGVFFKTSCLVYFPYIVFNFLLVGFSVASDNKFLPNSLKHFLASWYWLVAIIVLLFAHSTSLGIFALLVKQVQSLSKSSISLFEVLKTYTKNFTNVIFTALSGNFQLLLNYALCAPIVILEKKTGKEALQRSSFLINHLKPTMIALQIRSLFISAITLLAAPITFILINIFCFILSEEVANTLLKQGTVKAFIFIPSAFVLLPGMFLILVYPIIAIAITLFYFKVKAITGEDLETAKVANSQGASFQNKYSTPKRTFAFISVLVVILVSWLAVKDILLTLATSGGLTNVVEALILVGANANAKINISIFESDFSTTPLIYAVSNAKEKPEMLKLFLENKADVNTANGHGWTPLMEAISQNNLKAVKMLVDYGANINASSNYYYTPLMKAVYQGNLPIVEFFLTKQVEINALNSDEQSALFISVASGNAYITKALLDKGAKVEISDSNGNSPLTIAAAGGDSYIVDLLIKQKADINYQDGSERSPLIIAVINNNKEVIEKLLNAGAKTDFKDKEGKTALDYAKTKDYKEIISLLEKN